MPSKDEMILDILEKLDQKTDKLTADISEMKIEQAVMDGVVKDHARRSTASEERLGRLEESDQFRRNALVIISSIGGLIVFAITVYPYLALLLKA